LICACVSLDAAPTWLIYDTPDGKIAWLRVPDGTEPSIWSDAWFSAGGHADPAEVLRWLQHDARDPWSGGGDGFGDPDVVERLRAKIDS
jgi:hypothetical protein